LNLGVSLPSGSTNETQITPVSGGQLVRLPYIMQLGSGTVDLMPGVTYAGHWKRLNWGGQIGARLRAGTNSIGYILGDRYEVTGWTGVDWNGWLSNSFRLDWRQDFNIRGIDPLLDPTITPLNDPFLQARRRLDALFGLDIRPTGGVLGGTHWAVEAGLPAFQHVDGPQLRVTWVIQASLTYSF
jgi:hypothetical protein